MASAHGRAPQLHWQAAPGDWTLVIMDVDPASPLDVTVTGSVTIPILGPIGFAVLAVAIALLVAGIWVTARAAAHAPAPATPPAAS